MNEVALRAEYNKCSTPTEQTDFLRKMKSAEFNEEKMISVFGITRQRVNQVWKSTSHGRSHLVLSPAQVTALNAFFESADNLADAKRLYDKYNELEGHSNLGLSAFSIRLRKFRTPMTSIKSSKKRGKKSW
jgi:hypothetical protein